MIQSKFKYTSELGAKAGVLAYKNRSKKKDMYINIIVPIGILIMVGLLIFDYLRNNNYIFDIVLLVLLVVLEVLNIIMPKLIYSTQKKYLKKIEDENFDYYLSEYDKGVFKEKFYKDNKLMYHNEILINKIANFLEFEHYFLIIFDNYATLLFDLNSMQSGTVEDLKSCCANELASRKLKK